MASRMKGNFWTVVMTIRLPSWSSVRRMARALGVAHDGADLGELLDGVPDLLVQQPPVGDHDHRIEERLAVPLQPDELVAQPGDGVGLAAARRVLDQILGADSPTGHVRQQLAHHVELVVAGP